MPRIKLTKTAIDTLPIPDSDLVYWDVSLPGFGVKTTPKGRKVFIVLYRAAGGRLRKYTIGPYGRVTLHQAKLAAQKIFTAKLDPHKAGTALLDFSSVWPFIRQNAPSTANHISLLQSAVEINGLGTEVRNAIQCFD